MKISILVTYYNQAHFVKHSLESIIALDIPCEYEILVGDDGSSDGTIEEVKKYARKNSHIKIFVMERTENVKYDAVLRASANRLNLLENASGDYYCILDGDDWYSSRTFVKEAVAVMENDKNISVCAFNFAWVSDDDTKIQTVPLYEGKVSAKEYLRTAYIHAAACVFRNIFDSNDIKLIKSIGCFDDQDITILHLNHGAMYYIPKVVLAYRQTGMSLWTSMAEYEKHVLNACYYDIIIKYGNKYIKELHERFFVSLMFVWENRKRFYTELGNEKANQYISLAEKFNGIFYRVINFDKLDKKEKKCVRVFFKDTLLGKTVKWTKYILRFIKKVIKAVTPYGIVRFIQIKDSRVMPKTKQLSSNNDVFKITG